MTRTGDAMRAAAAHLTVSGYFPSFPPEWTRRAPSALWLWLDRQRQRAALAELDDRLLDDVGISRRAAEEECRRWA
jgi:uncharacterized protein YjiS (DUF1127 family)